MQAAFDTAVTYVHDRKQFNVPIGTFQLMQGKIADMYVKLNSTRSYVYAVAKGCDRGRISRRVGFVYLPPRHSSHGSSLYLGLRRGNSLFD
jgi:alkylation response protein AidB-like acyl-CoA dehydrogenase